ncbi:hypothetical protein MLD38_020080 [Melastoma candidum]|uniref:Uncharacterized protein n=1 Tax=Melastoma candidum TaxID=119954 RepID=A0ACB9QCB8_9MYRT|nr:hypothetical protein MLD38_020080 [Melastoma candidum]
MVPSGDTSSGNRKSRRVQAGCDDPGKGGHRTTPFFIHLLLLLLLLNDLLITARSSFRYDFLSDSLHKRALNRKWRAIERLYISRDVKGTLFTLLFSLFCLCNTSFGFEFH